MKIMMRVVCVLFKGTISYYIDILLAIKCYIQDRV